jgi:AraC-like DNA-binding protein
MLADAADFAPLRFSTCELPKRERLPAWREQFGHSVVRVDIEPLSGVPFRAEATLRALPGLRTIACTGSPVRNRRTPAQVADGDNCIGLFVNLGTRAATSQRDRDVELGRGDAVLISHEPSVVTPSPSGFLGVIVPHAALASRARAIDDAAMRLIPHSVESLRLVVNYLSVVQQELVLATPKLRRVVVSHIHDLLALTLGSSAVGESSMSAVVAARLAAALDHITRHFEAPELSLAAVARSQGISPRYLQRLMEASGKSYTVHLNELRLQKVFTLLTEASDSGCKISDIALQSGFSDISHFNRLFRSHFGDTPSGVRGQSRNAQLTAEPSVS